MQTDAAVNQVRERIREFILDKYPLARKHGLTTDSPLIEGGYLDSMGVLDLVGFVEEQFGITVADEELLPENFQSVTRLADFVRRKGNGSSC